MREVDALAPEAGSLPGYQAVRTGVGMADRSDRAVVRVWGREPIRMVQGLITNDLQGAPAGRAIYAAMLTPRGRTVSDLRAVQRAGMEGEEVLLEVPVEGLAGVEDQLRKFVPPRLARSARAEEVKVVGLYGPESAALAGVLFGTELPREEDEWTAVSWEGHDLVAVATRYAGGEPGLDLLMPSPALPDLRRSALAQGAIPLEWSELEMLRIEAGRPRYGPDLTEETIPTEAWESTGQMTRGLSFNKGCYTGQEVIVRIAHRGHVNRHLRGLLLGEVPAPEPRTPLVNPDTGKEVGWTTSSAVSPLAQQTISLGYVRREFGPGDRLRLGDAAGPGVTVSTLPFFHRVAV